ncbi:cytochrome P450 [Thioalkalicoccus limnaeus]
MLLVDRVQRRSDADPARVLCRWAGLQPVEDGTISVRTPGRRVALVVDGERSRQILDASPASGACPPGRLKRKAMSFLAPRALTIAHGEDWARLRAFHERVLDFDHRYPLAQRFLDRVRAAFAQPVHSPEDIRRAMGKAMLGIVPGDASREGLLDDVQALFEAVQSPVRRMLLGFRYRRVRERLYEDLRGRVRQGAAADPGDLMDLALQEQPPADEDELIQQIPHWMFTFTGSGTDLLTRTLALITARAEVHRRVRDELAGAGALDQAATLSALRYTEACLLEAGRLFPPAARTFHRSADDKTEIAHWFPLLHRDPALGDSVDAFRPERWLNVDHDAAADASLLFLRGPRRCPGQPLILFVCKAALARQLGEIGFGVRASRLSMDPLPVRFPLAKANFHPETPS